MEKNQTTDQKGKKSNKKKIIASITAAALAAGILIPGTLAYLTDNETALNTFTVGRTSIETEEPNWNTTDTNENGIPDDAENVVPNQEIKKDPQVKNTGNNDAIVFMRVTVPVKDVTLIADNGTLAEGAHSHKAQEIFYLKTKATSEDTHQTVFNTDKWMELPSKEVNTGRNGAAQQVGQRTYVFGYRTRLAKPSADGKMAQTESLFDKVQVKNIIENEVSSEQMNNIKVETWAIQADNIDGNGANGLTKGVSIDTKNDLNENKLNYIYDVFVNQNGELTNDGTFKYSTYQDGEHGSVEKESSTSGTTDINGKLVHSKLRATVTNSYLVPKSANKANASEGYKYSGYPDTTKMIVTFLEKGDNAKDGQFTYTTSNPAVATVATDGTITALHEGTATITAKATDGAFVSINVHVVKDSRVVEGHVAANDNDNRPQETSEQ